MPTSPVQDGSSPFSAAAAIRVSATPPGAPQQLRVVQLSRDSATLCWQPPPDDGGLAVRQFEGQVKAEADGGVLGEDWTKIYWVRLPAELAMLDSCGPHLLS